MIGKRLARIGAAPFLFFLAVAILVIVVAVPVLLIFWNAFWVDGHFNVRDVVKILSEAETYKALGNSMCVNVIAWIGERIWIGEYGWGGSQSTDQQEPTTRAYLQRLLRYGAQSPPYILFWEIYNNETNRLFCLIDSNNVKTASYYLHQRFINNARLATARFKETNGRLPNSPEFVSLVSPMLDRPLPVPVGLGVSNVAATLLSNSSARISGSLAQGIYGDDGASVSVSITTAVSPAWYSPSISAFVP